MALVTDIPVALVRSERSGVIHFLVRLFREKPLGAAGGVIFVLFLLCGIFADVLAPYGMNQISPINRLKPPSLQFPFGTDNLGRDMLSRCLYGAQLSVIIGFCAAGIATVIRAKRPDVRLIGVQAERAAAYPASLAAGHPVALDRMSTMADGIAAACRRLHAAPRFATDFSIFRKLDELLALCRTHGLKIPKGYEERLPAVTEIEAALEIHPDVLEAAVFGIPDEEWGESVHAVVVLREGSTMTEAEVVAHCRQHLAGYKIPRSVTWSPELPKTGSGKILKRDLRAPFWAGRDSKV